MSAPAGRRARFPLARQRLMRADVQRLYERGRRARCALFTVVVVVNELGRARLGLSVSKRNLRRAVDRNRVRRILREAFRLELANLPAGVDVIVISAPLPKVSGRGARLELAAARAELVRLVARALAKPARAAKKEAEAE